MRRALGLVLLASCSAPADLILLPVDSGVMADARFPKDAANTGTPLTPDAGPSADGGSMELDAAMDAGATDAGVVTRGLTPAAPTTVQFQWQGQQRHFNDTACLGRVAMAVGATAVCYGHQDGTMRCAGRVAQTNFGRIFSRTDQQEVDQILISRSVGFADGIAEGICVHRQDGTAACLGNYNSQGQFGTGNTSPVTSFTRWGTAQNLVALATGTWDSICALTDTGVVLCAGLFFGATPMPQPIVSNNGSLWVTTFGAASVDDDSTFRVSNSVSECRVTAAGGDCLGQASFGIPGEVVDLIIADVPSRFCYLDTAGSVYCRSGPKFRGGTVLALSANFDGSALCAVYNDGSLWCVGSNEEGKLGVGEANALPIETQVQPPGSVYIGCP